MEKETMTPEEYADDCGEHCPNKECGSLRVEAVSSLDHCAHKIYQECRCLDCGYEFTDEYTLSGFHEVQDEENC